MQQHQQAVEDDPAADQRDDRDRNPCGSAERDPKRAREAVDAMCRKLLANTVIENYSIEIAE